MRLYTEPVESSQAENIQSVLSWLAAGLALVPIGLSAGEPGSEIQASMATVIMVGLLSAASSNMVNVRLIRFRGRFS